MPWTVRISKQARADLDHFRAYDRGTYQTCNDLSNAVAVDPYGGPGKPLRLSEAGGEVWFRRTSLEHRMVYEVFDDVVIVASYRTHVD